MNKQQKSTIILVLVIVACVLSLILGIYIGPKIGIYGNRKGVMDVDHKTMVEGGILLSATNRPANPSQIALVEDELGKVGYTIVGGSPVGVR